MTQGKAKRLWKRIVKYRYLYLLLLPGMRDIKISCMEAQDVLNCRMFCDTRLVFSVEDLELLAEKKEKFYPFEVEQQIINALFREDLQAAKIALQDFLSIVQQSKNYFFVRQSFLILIAGIGSEFQKRGGDVSRIMDHKLIDSLSGFSTMQQVRDFFEQVLFPLYFSAKRSAESEITGVVPKIIQYITENHTKDVSLVQCADAVGLSPSYISRIFRQETGLSFLEYTIHIKIDTVKRMLLETDLSINKIAENVGYSPRSLYRVFFQQVGMSPNEFRKRNR